MIMLAVALLMSMVLCLLFGVPYIDFLKKKTIGQYILDVASEAHAKKAGTPTMGGLIFFISVAATILITGPKLSDQKMIILYSFLAFGFIGFMDDMLKIIHKDNLGLKAGQKFSLQFLVALV